MTTRIYERVNTNGCANFTKGKRYEFTLSGNKWKLYDDNGTQQYRSDRTMCPTSWKLVEDAPQAKPPADESGPALWDQYVALKRIADYPGMAGYKFTIGKTYPVEFTTGRSTPYITDDTDSPMHLPTLINNTSHAFFERWEPLEDGHDYYDKNDRPICTAVGIPETKPQPKEPTMALNIKKTTLINGKDVDDCSATELMALINKLLTEKDALHKLDDQVTYATDTMNETGYLSKQIRKINKQITKLATLLDAK